MYVCMYVDSRRAQEEETLKAALELSKAECSTNGGEEESTEPEQQTTGGDLLLDFSSTGTYIHKYLALYHITQCSV